VLFLPSASAPALVLVSTSLQPGLPGPAWAGLAPSNIPRSRHWDLRASDAFVDVDFITFAPWQTSQQALLPIAVNISAPGLFLNGSKGRLSVLLPPTVRFRKPPAGTLHQLQTAVGSRFVRVEGTDVLPLKRWIVAAFKSDDVGGSARGVGLLNRSSPAPPTPSPIVCKNCLWPSWSWDTVGLKTCWPEEGPVGETNWTSGKFADNHLIAGCKQLKLRNPQITCIFYHDSERMWTNDQAFDVPGGHFLPPGERPGPGTMGSPGQNWNPT
jgi:hypothetical protein